MSKVFSTFLIIGLAGLGCALLLPLLDMATLLIPVAYGLMLFGTVGASTTMIVNTVRNATS